MNRDMLENKVLRYIRRVTNTHKVVSFDFRIKQDITDNEYGRIDWNVIEENAPEPEPEKKATELTINQFKEMIKEEIERQLKKVKPCPLL